MPSPKIITRRQALKTGALAALVLPVLGSVPGCATPPEKKAARRPSPLRLGVASYSTRLMSLDDTISTLHVLRITNVGLHKSHCPWETASTDQCRAVGEKLKAAGIALTASGVVALPNDEAAVRKAFDNVRAAGMVTMVCKPDLAVLPLIEKCAKEYDQKVAIHNHGPEDKVYPSPYDVWNAIQPFDPRIGMCLDVGHAARDGVNPIEAIHRCASRIYDVHLKDSTAIPGALRDIPVAVGAGRLDIPGILAALTAINYSGVIEFEYEKNASNPVTGLAESVGYVRGLLAAMG